jgi:hypothetical protein
LVGIAMTKMHWWDSPINLFFVFSLATENLKYFWSNRNVQIDVRLNYHMKWYRTYLCFWEKFYYLPLQSQIENTLFVIVCQSPNTMLCCSAIGSVCNSNLTVERSIITLIGKLNSDTVVYLWWNAWNTSAWSSLQQQYSQVLFVKWYTLLVFKLGSLPFSDLVFVIVR